MIAIQKAISLTVFHVVRIFEVLLLLNEEKARRICALQWEVICSCKGKCFVLLVRIDSRSILDHHDRIC